MIVLIKRRLFKVATPEKLTFGHFKLIESIPPENMRLIFCGLLVPVFGKWKPSDFEWLQNNTDGVTIETVEKVCSFFLLSSQKYAKNSL